MNRATVHPTTHTTTHATSSSPQHIVDAYMHLMKEYIDAFGKFTAETSAVQYDCMFYVGINIINKVYEYMLMKYGNVKNANYYGQKSYVYFIEYMEQIHEHGLALTINHNDAILFIYKKTIFESSDNGTPSTNDTMGNIFSLQQNTTILNIDECIATLQRTHSFMNCLLHWDNIHITTANRINICKHLLPSLLKFTNHGDITREYLEYIRSITKMSFTDYYEFLTEINKLFEVTMLHHITDINDLLIEKFYLDNGILRKKIEDNNMKELVYWLYDPIIG